MIRFRERAVAGNNSLLFLPTDARISRLPRIILSHIGAKRPGVTVHINPDAIERDIRTEREQEHVPIEEIHAIVLAGGIASRMKTSDPKQLISITPESRLIDFPMVMLANAGIQDITVSCVRYTVDPIVQHADNSAGSNPAYGRAKFFVKEEPEGVIPAIKGPIDEYDLQGKPLIIVHGDEVLFADLGKMYEYHRNNHNPITVCMTGDPLSKNKVFLQTDENGRVVQVGRYPDDVTLSSASLFGYRYTLTGLWIVDPEYVDFLKDSKGADPFIFEAARQGLLHGYSNSGLFFNCNTPADIETTRQWLVSKNE